MSSVKNEEPSPGQRTRKSQRDLNKEATREAILRAARKLFARRGYSDTSLQAVVEAARVTTGAVYHHFQDKRGLFQAVAESVELEILKRVAQRVSGLPTAWEQVMAGALATLEICIEPEIRRIVFVDAPNVIGAAKWRQIELKFGYGMLCETLRELQRREEIRETPVEILGPMILGTLIEAANAIASTKDREVALEAAQKTVSLFLESLRVER